MKKKLENNTSSRAYIEILFNYGYISNLPKLNIFKLVSRSYKNSVEDYVCYDFVIEFLKKYSTLDNFIIPRENSDRLRNKKIFIKNFKSFFSFSNNKNNIKKIECPTNFGIINYYDGFKLTHTGILIEYNSNFYVISKFGDKNIFLHKIEDVPTVYGNKIKFFKLEENEDFEKNKIRLSAMIINHINKKGYFKLLEK